MNTTAKHTGMLRLPNNVPAPSSIVIGNPGSRRVVLFEAALARAGYPPPQIIAYQALLDGQVDLATAIPAGAIVRIESPGREWAVERALIAAGADSVEDGDYERIDPVDAARLPHDHGRLWYLRQWYCGFRSTLHQIEQQLRHAPPHTVMNDPQEIATMFDKPACHARLADHGVAVPLALGPVHNFEALTVALRAVGWARVFIKVAHGSSGSGVVAYQVHGSEHRATTTVELVEQGGELRLYNSRRLRTYRDLTTIRRLIDALCRQRVHVEQWLPKAGLLGQTCDVRVMVVGGQATQMVARLSRTPITNLHLLNTRADPALLQARMAPHDWQAALASCTAALGCFPRSLYGGVDLVIAPNLRRHAVLEVNAFGDLLPGILWNGQDTYATELAALATGAGQWSASPLPIGNHA